MGIVKKAKSIKSRISILRTVREFLSVFIPIVRDINGHRRISRRQTLHLLGAVFAILLALGYITPEQLTHVDQQALNNSIWNIVDAVTSILGALATFGFLHGAVRRQEEDEGQLSSTPIVGNLDTTDGAPKEVLDRAARRHTGEPIMLDHKSSYDASIKR